ncbi:uncharacterized protein [Elaeis guineensis]|uniref:uncharacterized protein n=1 Tax=Elaeis guineensis var. tenera TaxID=51953 RepID=UPI003C6D58D1
MKASHLLLGRPWQYDRRAIHDGFKNTYSFVKNGKSIVLAPLSPQQVQKDQLVIEKGKKENLFANKGEVKRVLTNHEIIFVLVAKQVPSEEVSLPPQMKEILEEFTDVFPEELPKGLLPIKGIEHQIDLIPGFALPNRPAYRCNPEEIKELQGQVADLLEKGYVRESMSPCSVPALLVPKKDGSMRMCVDSRAINKITIKYRYPILRLDDMLDELHGAKVFSKIDLRSGYHQIRMKEGDEWKTAFKTKFGLYEWTVMPFGLSNAPSTFMRLMNHVLHKFIVFLGYVVSQHGVEVDEEKVKAIKEWPVPTNHLKGQSKLNRRHAKWMEFLKIFPYVIKYKKENVNIVADALSKRYALISLLNAKLMGFELIIDRYKDNPKFVNIYEKCEKGAVNGYYRHDEYLFKSGRLCIPNSSIRELLVREAHGGGLAGHFGEKKILEMMKEHFYWPAMIRNVHHVIERKSKFMPRADGPFRVIEKVNDNAYKIELPDDYNVSATFNVRDLSPYLEDSLDDEEDLDLRVAVDFKVMYENMAYLLKNKEVMDANLIILQEEKKKESKLASKLKYQLEKKLKALKEKT